MAVKRDRERYRERERESSDSISSLSICINQPLFDAGGRQPSTNRRTEVKLKKKKKKKDGLHPEKSSTRNK